MAKKELPRRKYINMSIRITPKVKAILDGIADFDGGRSTKSLISKILRDFAEEWEAGLAREAQQ